MRSGRTPPSSSSPGHTVHLAAISVVRGLCSGCLLSVELSGVSVEPLPGRSTAGAARQRAVVALSAAEQLLSRTAR